MKVGVRNDFCFGKNCSLKGSGKLKTSLKINQHSEFMAQSSENFP